MENKCNNARSVQCTILRKNCTFKKKAIYTFIYTDDSFFFFIIRGEYIFFIIMWFWMCIFVILRRYWFVTRSRRGEGINTREPRAVCGRGNRICHASKSPRVRTEPLSRRRCMWVMKVAVWPTGPEAWTTMFDASLCWSSSEAEHVSRIQKFPSILDFSSFSRCWF